MTTENQVQEKIYTIDGVDYKDSELSTRVKNSMVARQEVLNAKVRHEIELEKIDVLVNHYNKVIKEEIEKKPEEKK